MMDNMQNNPFGGQQMSQNAFNNQQMQAGGFNTVSMQQGGFNNSQMQQGGFNNSQAQQSGLNNSQVQQGGFNNSSVQQNNPFAQNSLGGNFVPQNNTFAQNVSDLGSSVEPVNPFSQQVNDMPDNSQYIAAHTAAQFTGVKEKKKGKVFHFEFLPFGKQIGTYDMMEVQKYKKLCVWMHFVPFLIFAPLISDGCRKSGYVREVANGVFGLMVKYFILSMLFGMLNMPIVMLSLVSALRGVVRVLTTFNMFIMFVLGFYYMIIFVRSIVCAAKGIRFGHLFMSSYFDD